MAVKFGSVRHGWTGGLKWRRSHRKFAEYEFKQALNGIQNGIQIINMV